ncbi:MAG TPA: hypothetical protein P5121_30030, partial [Caldilineaceae bacterium]|nr:hypothetical protein [Caldilineaceae bacterium]
CTEIGGRCLHLNNSIPVDYLKIKAEEIRLIVQQLSGPPVSYLWYNAGEGPRQQHSYSFEVESDHQEWDLAIDGIRTIECQLAEL